MSGRPPATLCGQDLVEAARPTMTAILSFSYDKLAQRWIFSQFSVSTTPYLQCIAVSTTSDATGTYNRYSFQYSNFDDYPKMGVWSDAYYETFNMFNGNTFVGADACAYNRSQCSPEQTATQVCFQQGSSVGGLLPSDLDGTDRSARRFSELHGVLRHQQSEPLQISCGLHNSGELHLHRPYSDPRGGFHSTLRRRYLRSATGHDATTRLACRSPDVSPRVSQLRQPRISGGEPFSCG